MSIATPRSYGAKKHSYTVHHIKQFLPSHLRKLCVARLRFDHASLRSCRVCFTRFTEACAVM